MESIGCWKVDWANFFNRQRKQAIHGDLLLEVMNLLSSRFKPDPVMIKKRIESLMEREYLERVEGERQTYRYLVSSLFYRFFPEAGVGERGDVFFPLPLFEMCAGDW